MVKLIDGWLQGLSDNYFFFENSEPKEALLMSCFPACPFVWLLICVHLHLRVREAVCHTVRRRTGHLILVLSKQDCILYDD
jgi:hypothetical protein